MLTVMQHREENGSLDPLPHDPAAGPGLWPAGGPAPSLPGDDHIRLCGQATRTGKRVQRPSGRWVVTRLPVADEIPVHRRGTEEPRMIADPRAGPVQHEP